MATYETYETDPDYDAMYDTMKDANTSEAKVIQEILWLSFIYVQIRDGSREWLNVWYAEGHKIIGGKGKPLLLCSFASIRCFVSKLCSFVSGSGSWTGSPGAEQERKQEGKHSF